MTGRVFFGSADEGFAWFETFTNLERTGRFSGRDYKLDRMRELADAADHPERSFRSVHIAGSKGKGSTAVLAASVLEAAGYSTGLYTSPHLQNYRERISRPGGFFDDGILLEAMNAVREVIENRRKPEDSPTTFELLTLCAFFAFRAAGCEWAALETGLGGRLDSTNIVTPEACILTPVELEHTDILGTTLVEIATEKAGIIKPGIPVFMGFQKPEVEQVFRRRAEKKDAPLYSLAEELTRLETETRETGTTLAAAWRADPPLECTLAFHGRHQAENACLTALCLNTLARSGRIPTVTGNLLHEGLSGAGLPGRFEIMETDPLLILDTAHTPASIQRTVDTLKEINTHRGVLVFGAVSGKDIRGMARILCPEFDRIILSRPGRFKPSDPEEAARIFESLHPNVELEEDSASALEKARLSASGRLPVLVTGSFYMAAEIRKLL